MGGIEQTVKIALILHAFLTDQGVGKTQMVVGSARATAGLVDGAVLGYAGNRGTRAHLKFQ